VRIGPHVTPPTDPPHVVFGLLTVEIRGERAQERGESSFINRETTEDEVATEGVHSFPEGVESDIREAASTQAQAWKWYGEAVQRCSLLWL